MRKRIIISLFLICCLVMVAGCSKSNSHRFLSKKDQKLVWIGDRERSFSDSDHTDLKSEKEAVKLMQDTYKVSIPSYYNQVKKVLETNFVTEGITPGETLYAVFAKNNTLEFRTVYSFYQKEELQFLGIVSLEYEFIRESKKMKLKRQSTSVQTGVSNTEIPKEIVPKWTKSIAKVMNMDDVLVADGLAGYEKAIKQEGRNGEDSLPIVTNTNGLNEKKELGKSISAVYTQAGVFEEIYAEVSDNTE